MHLERTEKGKPFIVSPLNSILFKHKQNAHFCHIVYFGIFVTYGFALLQEGHFGGGTHEAESECAKTATSTNL